ncbi:MAG: hypothetical protein NVSMB66_3070 [Candidatus Doudnabacteria bacterium]
MDTKPDRPRIRARTDVLVESFSTLEERILAFSTRQPKLCGPMIVLFPDHLYLITEGVYYTPSIIDPIHWENLYALPC